VDTLFGEKLAKLPKCAFPVFSKSKKSAQLLHHPNLFSRFDLMRQTPIENGIAMHNQPGNQSRVLQRQPNGKWRRHEQTLTLRRLSEGSSKQPDGQRRN
jgi:hypothetical protein